MGAFRREGEMVAFLVTGAVIGTILGLRFRVLVLVPAILLAAAVIILSGSGHKLSVILFTLLGTVVSLQLGYIVGSILRFLGRSYLPAWKHSRSETKCLD
jgi:hypothetical protein